MAKHIGIYIRDLTPGGGAEKRSAVTAERLSRMHDVTLLVSGPCSLKAIEAYFAVDLSRVRVAELRLPGHDLLRQMLDAKNDLRRRTRADVVLAQLRRVAERSYFRQIRDLRLDLFINNQGWSILKCPAPAGIYMCMFPHDRKGELHGNHGRGALYEVYAALGNRVVGMTDEVLDSYDAITANSRFTADWIRRLWRRTAEVVYSACEDMGPPSVPKERIIVHTGRFVAEGRNDDKCQRTLVEAFRGMKQLHREGWELHLAGTLLSDAASARSYKRLAEEARDLPVCLHPSVPFEELRALYRRASIYWHATGYGLLAEKHPGKQEHFGMTTVEAMSAGAVPVVINSGGQCESVVHGSSGFLWNDLGELEDYTYRLANDPALLATFSRSAVERSNRFSRATFADRVEALVERLLR